MGEPAATPPSSRRLSAVGRRAVRLWRLIVAVVLGYRGEALALRAGNLTFITITSLVPLVAVIFSLLHALNAKRIDPLVIKFFEDILSPGGRAQSEQTIRTFLSAANSRAAGGLNFLVVLVSAGVMLRHLDASLNDIWRVRQKRPILVSIGLYAGVLLVGPLLIALSLLGTEGAKQFLGWLEFPFSAQAYVLGSVLSAVLVFSSLYKVAPHAPVPWSSAIVGGGVAGLAWEAARHLYGGIASLFFSANKVYGSLGIAPLFLMWIYVGWYIVLSGARLAYAVEHADFHDEFRDLLEHPRSNELIASRIAEEVARAELDGLPAPTSKTLASTLRLPEQRVKELIQLLINGQLVLANEKGGLTATRDVKALTLADISAAVGGTARIVNREHASSTGHFESVARLFTSADETTVEKLKAISWADLARADGPDARKT
ncbi:MAG: YhjD/YihY/BrkB family envelope integrity protein [Myxococcota bacterium]